MIEIKRISDVFNVGSSKRVFKSEWTSEGVPFYRAREVVKLSKDGYVNNELFISEDMFQEYADKYGVPKSGDILVTGVGTLGICYQVKDHDRFYFKDGNIVWLKKREEVSSDYIEYCFKSPFVRRQIESTADAAVVGTYTITNARDTKIPLPPLPQQKKIAAILDAADTYRQKTKSLIAKYDELTQSLFLDMFGDPVGNPKGWEKVSLNELCDFKKTNVKPEEIVDGEIYIGLECIEKKTGVIIEKFIVETGEVKSNKFWFNSEFILYGKLRPYLNKVANPNFEGICSTDIIPIKPIKDNTSKEFIISLMRGSWFVAFADERSSGANLPRISPKEVEKFQTINPPLDLQNQFAERIQAIEAQKAQEQTSLAKAEDLFNSLLHGAFKGELV